MYLRNFVFARHIFVLTQSLQLQSLLLAKERVVLNFLVFRTSSIYPIGFMWPGFNDQVHEFVSSLDVTHRRQRIGGARRPGWLGHLSFRVRTAAQCSVLLALSFRSNSVTRKLTVLNSYQWCLWWSDLLKLPSAINPEWILLLLCGFTTAESRSAVMCTWNVTRGDGTNNRHHRHRTSRGL